MKHQPVYTPLLQLLLVTGLTGAAACRSSAVVQTSSEAWVGTSTTIQGKGASTSKVTLFSQRMVRPIESAGTVTVVQNAILTDTNSTWTDGQFGTRGVPAYVEFDNGWVADIADCSAANHCLTLAGSLGNAAVAGNAYRIHKHFTVATMFGDANSLGLKSGLNPSTADNVLLLLPQTQQTLAIFYYDDGTFHGWLDSSFSPADSRVIYPEQGVMIRRRLATDTSLFLTGPVKMGSTVVTIDQGYNLLGTLKSATSLSLSNLNIYTGNPTTGLASGLNPSSSDNLLVVQPNGLTTTYFYYNDSVNQGWLDTSFSLANNVKITPGTAFFVRRKAPNAAFNWTIPGE